MELEFEVRQKQKVLASAIRVTVTVEDDMAANFPLRAGDKWSATIDIETGRIRGWPLTAGARKLFLKVVDEGSYELLDSIGRPLAKLEYEYVPNCIPQEDGDYINFNIAEDGTLARWRDYCTPERVRKAFFDKDED